MVICILSAFPLISHKICHCFGVPPQRGKPALRCIGNARHAHFHSSRHAVLNGSVQTPAGSPFYTRSLQSSTPLLHQNNAGCSFTHPLQRRAVGRGRRPCQHVCDGPLYMMAHCCIHHVPGNIPQSVPLCVLRCTITNGGISRQKCMRDPVRPTQQALTGRHYTSDRIMPPKKKKTKRAGLYPCVWGLGLTTPHSAPSRAMASRCAPVCQEGA